MGCGDQTGSGPPTPHGCHRRHQRRWLRFGARRGTSGQTRAESAARDPGTPFRHSDRPSECRSSRHPSLLFLRACLHSYISARPHTRLPPHCSFMPSFGSLCRAGRRSPAERGAPRPPKRDHQTTSLSTCGGSAAKRTQTGWPRYISRDAFRYTIRASATFSHMFRDIQTFPFRRRAQSVRTSTSAFPWATSLWCLPRAQCRADFHLLAGQIEVELCRCWPHLPKSELH